MVHHILQTPYKDCPFFWRFCWFVQEKRPGLYCISSKCYSTKPLQPFATESLFFFSFLLYSFLRLMNGRITMFPHSALDTERSGAIKATGPWSPDQMGLEKCQYSNQMVRHKVVWRHFALTGDHFMPVVVHNSSDLQNHMVSAWASVSVRVASLGFGLWFEVVVFSRERWLSAQLSFLNSSVILVNICWRKTLQKCCFSSCFIFWLLHTSTSRFRNKWHSDWLVQWYLVGLQSKGIDFPSELTELYNYLQKKKKKALFPENAAVLSSKA